MASFFGGVDVDRAVVGVRLTLLLRMLMFMLILSFMCLSFELMVNVCKGYLFCGLINVFVFLTHSREYDAVLLIGGKSRE